MLSGESDKVEVSQAEEGGAKKEKEDASPEDESLSPNYGIVAVVEKEWIHVCELLETKEWFL